MDTPPTFEDRPAMHLVGLETRVGTDGPAPIGALWQRFHAEDVPGQIVGRLSRTAVAVYSDYEGDHTQPYLFFLGCETGADAPVPAGFVTRDLPAGPYARVEAVGSQPGALVQAWERIWASSIERSFQADYELHDPDTPERVVVYIR